MSPSLTARLKNFDNTLYFEFDTVTLQWKVWQKRSTNDEAWLVHTVMESNMDETMKLLSSARDIKIKERIAEDKKRTDAIAKYNNGESYALAREVASHSQNPIVNGNL